MMNNDDAISTTFNNINDGAFCDILMQVVLLWWSVNGVNVCQVGEVQKTRPTECLLLRSEKYRCSAPRVVRLSLLEENSQVSQNIPESSHLYTLIIFTVLTASQMTVLQCTVLHFWSFLNVLELPHSEISERRICASAPSDHQGASWPVGDTVAQCLRNLRNLSLLSILSYI